MISIFLFTLMIFFSLSVPLLLKVVERVEEEEDEERRKDTPRLLYMNSTMCV